MNIGIVGYGLVGKAVGIGMASIGHYVRFYDNRKITDFTDESRFDAWPIQVKEVEELTDSDIIFLCLPTPSNKDGSCNVSLIGKYVEELFNWNYQGIIAIKSTVEIGTTQKLIDQYRTTKIVFVPETLRERYALQDFIENHDVLVVGTQFDTIYDEIVLAHGKLPKKIIKLSPSEAETFKYLNNVYAKTLIVLANSFYELCNKMKVDYSKVKSAFVQRDHVVDIYLDCNEWLRGAAGVCLPKDCKAIANLVDKLQLNHIHFFDDIVRQNIKFLPTIFDGMRLK